MYMNGEWGSYLQVADISHIHLPARLDAMFEHGFVARANQQAGACPPTVGLWSCDVDLEPAMNVTARFWQRAVALCASIQGQDAKSGNGVFPSQQASMQFDRGLQLE